MPHVQLSRSRCIFQTFLMEFGDARRVANNSPPCTFTPDPPLELRSMPTPRGPKPVGYLSLGEPFVMWI